jgi:hypothetical protein
MTMFAHVTIHHHLGVIRVICNGNNATITSIIATIQSRIFFFRWINPVRGSTQYGEKKAFFLTIRIIIHKTTTHHTNQYCIGQAWMLYQVVPRDRSIIASIAIYKVCLGIFLWQSTILIITYHKPILL